MSSFEDKKKKGTVFNIQKYSVHDGPGIRTIVFLKGCPLSCRWCSNPESQAMQPELAFNENRCITLDKCQYCIKHCVRGAITRRDDGKILIDRNMCADCDMPCASSCPANGLIVYGQERTVDDVLSVVEQDAAFYARSGGGVTLSGGEPMMQGEFVVALLREARRRRLKTAIETCGVAPWAHFENAAPYLSSVLFDIKHVDDVKHAEFTGGGTKRIHENFTRLVTEFPNIPVLARTPIIPGFNNSVEDVQAIANFLKPFEHVRYEMLPYHRLGTQKYIFLDRVSPMGDVTLAPEAMYPLIAAAKEILGERLQVPK